MQESQQDVKSEQEVKKEEHEVEKEGQIDGLDSKDGPDCSELIAKAEDILLKVRDRGGRTLEFRVRET